MPALVMAVNLTAPGQIGRPQVAVCARHISIRTTALSGLMVPDSILQATSPWESVARKNGPQEQSLLTVPAPCE
jgi:hypothetical protein